MKVLVVGSGGREHALVWKMSQSPDVTDVFCAPGNAGTALDGVNVDIAETDTEGLVDFAKKNGIGLTVIGPEVPLVGGLADAFRNEDLAVFGPSKKAAELEGSKVFAKQLMIDGNVPTAEYFTAHTAAEALDYLVEREEEKKLVIKAEGLAAGKGVTICHSLEEAEEAIKRTMVGREFGDAGDRIIIEEFLEGQEASILALVDGATIMPLEVCQDHKPAHDGDTGPMTGGMGAYCPAPLVDDAMMEQIIEKILLPTVHTMRHQGRRFRGVLYAGLMITPQGPKVLEFNVRFGDPETQPVLMRLKTDVAKVLHAAATGTLHEIGTLEWDPRPSVCVVMASEGYPGSYEKGHVIRGLDEAAKLPDVKVFHAGTKLDGNNVVTNGGRVLGVTALGDTIHQAKRNAYAAVKTIRWDGAWCRKDISDKAR